MTPDKPRLAFVNTYAHLTRSSVENMLAESFPEFTIDHFSIVELIKQHPAWIPPNLLYTFGESGRAMLQRRLTLREAYLTTTFAFRRLHAAMRKLIVPGRHAFSFQMQSLYDTSVPGVPHFVYTDHTHLSNLHYDDFDRRQLRSRGWLRLERALYHNATTVFTRSTDVAADLNRFYDVPPNKVACVWAGSNVEIDTQAPPQNDDYSNQRILFVGIDWERKGGPELVAAFREVLRSHPRAQLVIAGAAVTPDVPNCTVLGRITATELAQHYQQASIFCLPTKREPFGIAFVEALQHRLPVVATRVGAVPDMVSDGVNGFLVAPGETAPLAESLNRLLADPQLCRTMGERSYEQARDRYDWRRVGARLRTKILPFIRLPTGSEPVVSSSDRSRRDSTAGPDSAAG
ncbi:MAG: glycosyltransferase family 4 protein [Sinobacteraceae bacterium]|nr:glycosyltransferase family 4 protein [Nevskiaceae bacterium]